MHCAVLLPKTGEVLVAGGLASGLGYLPSAELFSIKKGKWTAAASLASARSQAACALLRNGRALIAGGVGFDASQFVVSLTSVELFGRR